MMHLLHSWRGWSEEMFEVVADRYGALFRRRFQRHMCHVCGKVQVREIDRSLLPRES